MDGMYVSVVVARVVYPAFFFFWGGGYFLLYYFTNFTADILWAFRLIFVQSTAHHHLDGEFQPATTWLTAKFWTTRRFLELSSLHEM